jgi:hypothetical protein
VTRSHTAARSGGCANRPRQASTSPIYGLKACDYDRACAVGLGLIDVGETQALALETPDNATFVARPDGGMRSASRVTERLPMVR